MFETQINFISLDTKTKNSTVTVTIQTILGEMWKGYISGWVKLMFTDLFGLQSVAQNTLKVNSPRQLYHSAGMMHHA